MQYIDFKAPKAVSGTYVNGVITQTGNEVENVVFRFPVLEDWEKIGTVTTSTTNYITPIFTGEPVYTNLVKDFPFLVVCPQTTVPTYYPEYREAKGGNDAILYSVGGSITDEFIVYLSDTLILFEGAMYDLTTGERVQAGAYVNLLPFIKGAPGNRNSINVYQPYFKSAPEFDSAGQILPTSVQNMGVLTWQFNTLTTVNEERRWVSGNTYNNAMTANNAALLYQILIKMSGKLVDTTNPYLSGGFSYTGGGGGFFDETTDSLPMPQLPEINAYNTGMVIPVLTDNVEVKAFTDWLWTDSVWEALLARVVADPSQVVVSMSSFPVRPNYTTEGGLQVKGLLVGNKTDWKIITKTIGEYDLGSMTIKPYWGNYLDYNPYTTIELYLPFIGSVPIDVDQVMNSTLTVKYRVDFLTGDCVAYILIDGNLISQHAGNLKSEIPISRGENIQLFGYSKLASSIGDSLAHIPAGGLVGAMGAGLVGGGLGLGAGALATSGVLATPMATKVAQPLLSGARSAVNSASSVMGSKVSMSQTGAISASSGFLMNRYPVLTIRRPRQALPKDYAKYYGLPANLTVDRLASCQGFTKVKSIHLEGLTCTEPEKQAILNFLTEGVIL